MKKLIITSALLGSTVIFAQNTGIGTTNPTEKLDVAGNIKSTTINANTGSSTDKVVVADMNGVLKTIERSTLAGAYTAGAGINITGSTIAATGLEKITVGGKSGWRLIGTTASVASIGTNAVNLASGGNATGSYATTLGYIGNATGYASLSGGESSEASGDYSFSYGFANRARGYASLAIGRESFADAEGAVGIGYRARAYGKNSYSFGEYAFAFSMAQMVVGRNNTSEVVVEPAVFSKNKISIFKVGNGLGGTNTSDAFNVMRNGVTGIDIDNLETTTSDAKLQVNGKVLIGEFGDKDAGNSTIGSAGVNKAQLDVRGSIASSSLSQPGFTTIRPVYADENGVLVSSATPPPATDPIPVTGENTVPANQMVNLNVDSTKFLPVLIQNLSEQFTPAAYKFYDDGTTWSVRFMGIGINSVTYEILWQRRTQ